MSEFVEWGVLGRIVVLGLVVGAGLPTLFAVGVRALAGPGSRDSAGRRPPARLAVAGLSLSVVLAAIVTAIVVISTGGHS